MRVEQTVDAKLTALEDPAWIPVQEMQTFKTQRRHPHSPISELPDEVLLAIFMMMAAEFFIEQWNQVAHVCRRWRNVAIGAPLLWTNPPTHNHGLTMLMLERSKAVDLTIHLHDETSPETIQSILSCSERIRCLHIREEGMPDEDGAFNDESIIVAPPRLPLLLDGLQYGAPRMAVLEIVHLSYTKWNGVPLLRLLHPMARLQQLALVDVHLGWDVFPLPSLVHLYLDEVTLAEPVSMEQFIHTLRGMPLLETLVTRLSDRMFSGRATPQASLDCRSLQHLRLLVLKDCDPGYLQQLLRNATLPRLCCIDIEIAESFDYYEFLENHYAAIIPEIASLVMGGNFGVFNYFSFSFYYGKLANSDIQLPGFEYSFSFVKHQCPQSPYIRWEGPSRHGPLDHWATDSALHYKRAFRDLNTLCGADVFRLSHLELGGTLTAPEFINLFGVPNCVHLEEITVDGEESLLETLATVLAVPQGDQPGWQSPTVPFPELRVISCEDVRCGDSPSNAPSPLWDIFCDSLLSRQKAGHPLPKLKLRRCPVPMVQLERMEQTVIALEYNLRAAYTV